MRSSQRFYNTFSIFYPLIDLFLKPQKRVLRSEINKLPAGKILEIGAGNGSHLRGYLQHEVTAIDTSEEMLRLAGRYKSERISLLLMDGMHMTFPDQTFDYVILSHVITVVKDPESLLAEVHRVLKPDGKLFILNHFTPPNALKYIDSAFQCFSRFLHFRSVFHIGSLNAIRQFRLQREISFGRLEYFKLLIYSRL